MKAFAGLLFIVCSAAAFAASPLPALHADIRHLTASGVSSGGYMAVQFHVAHSDSVSGVGVVAGGPYYCAQGNLFSAYYNCMTPGWWAPLPAAQLLKAQADAFAAAHRIDTTANLAHARAWLFSGTNDHTVDPEVVVALRDFYAAYQAQVMFVADKPAGHGMVTESKGEACGATRSPFIVHCNYDAAGEMLRFLLGPLSPRAAHESGQLVEFDQNAYAGADARAIAMDEVGLAYVPDVCRSRPCRVHIAFHGCRQGRSEVGERFAREAGYNAWAGSNALIVLYPQVIKRYSPFLFNPRGCWDWWGYTGADYATKQGAQIRAVRAMLEALSR